MNNERRLWVQHTSRSLGICADLHQRGYLCILNLGHGGKHACSTGKEIVIWEQEEA